MAKVASILCRKCRAPLFCVAERSMENEWLFVKCSLLGIQIHVAGVPLNCASCGQDICIPRDLAESFIKGDGAELDPEGGIDVRGPS